MAINFSAQFIVNEKTSTRVLRLTDTSTGFTLSKGNFIVTFPDGSVVSNTDFSSPEISAPGGNTSISLITDIDNTVLTGTYVINYVALDTSLNEYNKTETFDFNWEKPAKTIINDSDVVLPEVQFKDLTAYETSGSFSGVLTRNFYTATPSTSEVGVITKTSVGDILTPSHLTKYYEGIYLVRSDISVAYTHTSKSWLTVAYTDLLQETFDVREAPTQDELVALMNSYKDQIEAYKTTNPSQYEILNEQYDLVLALYSHIIARYQTTTLDGSKAILDQLLGLLPPASSYTYKATQMLPFTINFTTSLTGSGTIGTLPKFTGTATLGDSIIKEDTNRIGIGKTPTTTLDVNGAIQGTSIVKSGGTSSEFLKADGSVDANTYLTTGSAASSYQPLDGDLSAIAVLAGAAGILTKVSANTWTLDTTSYQVLDADLTAIAALAGTSGFLIKTAANTWSLDTTSYQVLDADLTAIAALTGTSGILIKTAANTWALDAATYQLADADLTAIAALAGTSGLIRKTAANTYELDTSVYLTGINSGQITTALGFTPENAANKGVNNGYASLDGAGKVPSTQLPSYVDDVIEAANLAALPATGETGKIYITLDTNKVYRWSGSTYTDISSSTAVWGGITGTLLNQIDLQSALDAKLSTSTAASTYVPYTGATTNVDLGEYNIKSGAFKFDLTPSNTLAEGTMQWNSSDGTVDIGLKGGNVVLQVGQETVYEVRNETGTQIPNGTAVYANGVTAGSSRITAAPYVADGSVRENRFLGLATENISNGVNGFVTHFGYVRGLDTRGTSSSSISVGDETWAVGDILYVHPTVPGKLTNVKPQHEITVAIIITRHQSSGILFVRPSSGGHLEDIHDVAISSIANNQGLFYESSTSLWKNKSISTVLGYTPQPAFASGTGFVRIDGTTISYVNETYATTTQLDLKANILNPVFTDNIYISGTNPRLYFTDTDSNPDYTIFIDSGVFYILNQTTGSVKLSIAETGNISAGSGNSMVATSFIKRGGTSSEFLMADGSVTSGAVVNYPGIGIAVSGGGGWLTSIDDNSVNWNAAYSARISSLTTTGNSGAATLASNVLNIPNYTIAGLGGQAALSGTGFVKISGTTISYDNSTYYLASNPSGYITSAALAPYLPLAGGTLTGALGGTSATFSGDVTANSFVKSGGTSFQFLKADGSVDIRSFVTTGALDNYLPLTGGSLANTLSSGYVLSVTNNGTAADSNGLYVNIDTASTGTPFKVARGGVSLINVNYLGATVLKSTITAISFIKSSGTSSEYLMADGSVSTGMSFTYPGAGIAVSTGSAWGTSITNNSSNWNTAFGWGNHAGLYLPLSGGTLTGALSGTSATFSGQVGLMTHFAAYSDAEFMGVLGFNRNPSTGAIYNNSRAAFQLQNNLGTFQFKAFSSAGADLGTPLTLASTGAATFSSNIDLGGSITSTVSGTSELRLRGGGYGGSYNTSLRSIAGGIGVLQFGNNADNYILAGNTATGGFLDIRVNCSAESISSGSSAMRITSGGNVGIGTTAPDRDPSGTRSLAISGGGSLAASLDLYGNGRNYAIFTGGVGSLGFFDLTAGSERMRITSGGQLQSSASGANTVSALFTNGAGDANFKAGFANGSGTGVASEQAKIGMWYGTSGTPIVHIGLLRGNSADSLGMTFNVSNAEYMRINNAGNVLIGKTSDNGYKLQVLGSISATSFFETSDLRLKNITKKYDSEEFGAIEFGWIDGRDSKNHWGYVAQDVQKYLPDAIHLGNDGFLAVDYNQAHTFKIAKVEDEVTLLKKRVAELESQLNSL
jgi:hypothetical protein